jgi:hypothetical protein
VWTLVLPRLKHLFLSSLKQDSKIPLISKLGLSKWQEFVPSSIVDRVLDIEVYLDAFERQTHHITYQSLQTPLFQQYATNLFHSFPFNGPIDDNVWRRVRNHPKKVLIIAGEYGSYFKY